MPWRAKLMAAGVHLALTMLVVVPLALWVFKSWFPEPFEQLMDAQLLLRVAVGSTLVLGPMLSLVVFNPRKHCRALWADCALAVVIQIFALGYGFYIMAQWRPMFLVFAVDRYVVVRAGELASDELQKAPELAWRAKRWLGGYETVYVSPKLSADETFALTMSAFGGGRDLQHVVKNYGAVSAHLAEILEATRPLDAFRQQFPEQAVEMDAAIKRSARDPSRLRWLPVQAQTRDGVVFWTVLIDTATALPAVWVNADPW